MMRKNSTPDSTLVSDFINGCETSLEILIKRHKQRLYSFIYSKVLNRDIAEDVFIDTYSCVFAYFLEAHISIHPHY